MSFTATLALLLITHMARLTVIVYNPFLNN